MKRDSGAPKQNDIARQIYDRLRSERGFTLTKARGAYKEAFGLDYNDPKIDERYEKLMAYHVGSGDDVVPMPAWLALAFYLREGLGRTRGPIAKEPSQEDVTALLIAKGLAAAYMRKGCTAYNANRNAAIAITHLGYEVGDGQFRRFTSLSAKQVLERFSHPGRYGLDFYFDDDSFDMPWSSDPPDLRWYFGE